MSWFIKVRNMVYGPYSTDRMARFASEGRLSSKTLVSDNRDDGFKPASENIDLEKILQNNGLEDKTSQATASQSASTIRQFALHTRLSTTVEMEFGSLLRQFGEPIEPIPGIWLLKAATTSAQLRNVLSRELGGDDSLLIFELIPDQASWFNIGKAEDQQFRAFLGS